jgi:hypothetical protein
MVKRTRVYLRPQAIESLETGYIVIRVINRLTPLVGKVLTERQVKELLRERLCDVTISA